jgi:hypothetical protein
MIQILFDIVKNCWQELQLAQFAQDLFLSLMSNFKMPKGEFVGQFAQAPWISFHRHNLNFRDCQFTLGVSISGFWEFLFQDFCMVSKKSNITKSRMPKYRKGHTSHDSRSFYFGILGVSISGFLHGKQKLQHHKVLNAEMSKCEKHLLV